MIRKVKGGCIVISETGKRLYPAKGKKPVSEKKARARLAEIEMFKHMKAKR